MRVLFHNNCFDGACSASLFTRFHRERIGTAGSYSYGGLRHGAGANSLDTDLSGDENAVVDFRYSPSPRLTWWFDHHQSAFTSEADRANFEREQKSETAMPRKFFDPLYTSCTGLIADVARERFGFDTAELADLIHWANIIDGAKFRSADEAVAMAAPAMRIAMIVESVPDPEFIPRLIPLLTSQSLSDTLAEPFVIEQLEPRLQKHQGDVTLMRSRAAVEDGVITFDISDQQAEGFNKFIPYYLLPEGVYCVGLSRSSFRAKISVGTSPWTTVPAEELANIAAICERFGGGGHARVGAISLPPEEMTEARRIAGVVTGELRALRQANDLPTHSAASQLR